MRRKEWYENLIGKEIVFLARTGPDGKEFNAVVSGMNYDLGLTIQATTAQHGCSAHAYLYCLRGPASNVPGTGKAKRNSKYRRSMSYAAKMIRNGYFDAFKFAAFRKDVPLGYIAQPSAQTCPFAQ